MIVLVYFRRRNGDKVWIDDDRRLSLWRGHSHWYYDTPGGGIKVLCPASWPDGDALTLYLARQRIREKRASAHGAHD